MYYAFDKDGKVSSTMDPVVAATWVYSEEEGKVWYLADWKIDKNYWSRPCKVVIATSPGDDVIRLFVPMWSREEIHTLNDQVFKHPKAEVDDRFDKWGGVPRHVLSKTNIHQGKELEDAIHSIACTVCDRKRLFVANAGQDGYASDLVYHITVKDDDAYAVATKKLATSYVIEKLVAFLNIDKGPSGPEERAKSFIKAMDLMIIETEFPKDMTPEQLDHTVIKLKDRDNTDWDIICGRRVLQLMVSDKRRDEGLFPYGQRPGWTKAFDFLWSVYKDGSLELVFVVPLVKFSTFSITVHGETLGDARLRIMNDYAAAGIENDMVIIKHYSVTLKDIMVTICCKPVHL
ncbi:hypothetical protein SELMODRAFT_407963 [Selaginella moellendorffii]|uniref:Uncharacterized protein n=1 Tax=Selaginella moellendorffii TaxID=88036 RepID=D8R5C6_SELML|nr:hypothetical protein SELMODRAFT_407963 [Selaginella moellendorffii]